MPKVKAAGQWQNWVSKPPSTFSPWTTACRYCSVSVRWVILGKGESRMQRKKEERGSLGLGTGPGSSEEEWSKGRGGGTWDGSSPGASWARKKKEDM